MNIIRQYEFGLIDLDELTEIIWGCGERTIAEVGEDCFCFYLNLTIGKNPYSYYISYQATLF
ncbi:hypothetical protein [Enterococcus sp. AZ103]|uniref:hypothetical protein n=1 Tax=Enterococcus sp. AZ103 TaxID=2774628 RepID=UPI003F2354EC